MKGDQLVVAMQEERASGAKGQRIFGSIASQALERCLAFAGIGLPDIDVVGLATASRRSNPLQDTRGNPQLRALRSTVAIQHVGHHRAHAASAIATSGFADGVVLVVDGMGSPLADLDDAERASLVAGASPDPWETVSAYRFGPDGLVPLFKHAVADRRWLVPAPGPLLSEYGSLGGMYAAASLRIFQNAGDAGKVMGLAAHGRAHADAGALVRYTRGQLLFPSPAPGRWPGAPWPRSRQTNADLAASVQLALETALIPICRELQEATGSPRLCLAGGVMLNGLAVDRIIRDCGFASVHVVPAADDSGIALGAAVLARRERSAVAIPAVRLASDRLGPAHSAEAIQVALSRFPLACAVDAPPSLWDVVAERIAAGAIVGWFQGRSEFGPRALGGRSILADPRSAVMKNRLNLRVKQREAFRPFAPAVLATQAGEWFDLHPRSSAEQFMLRVVPVHHARRNQIPCVTHVDGTARPQLVDMRTPELCQLIERFALKSGVPMLVNTSFNTSCEPIVETPTDALWTLFSAGLTFCVIGNLLIEPTRAARRSLLRLVPRLASDKRITRQPDAFGAHGSVTSIDARSGFCTPLTAPELALLDQVDGRRTVAELCAHRHRRRSLQLIASLRRKGALVFDAYAPR